MELNLEAIYKSRIEELWNDKSFQHVDYIERGYAVQRAIKHDSLLFVGINPSLENKNDTTHKRFFYRAENDEKVHKYFNKFPKIAKDTNMHWSHLDLLYLRETNQNNIRIIYEDPSSMLFIRKQLELSKEIIEQSKPKIIVVCNAYARELFTKPYFFKTQFDEIIGTHRIKDNIYLNSTPVFFTGMITGQRALDNGSYDRLVWHIKQVLIKYEYRVNLH